MNLSTRNSPKDLEYWDFRLRVKAMTYRIRDMLKEFTPYETFIKLVDWCQLTVPAEDEQLFRQFVSNQEITQIATKTLRRSVTLNDPSSHSQTSILQPQSTRTTYGCFVRSIMLWYEEVQPRLQRIRPQVEITPAHYLIILISAMKDYKKLVKLRPESKKLQQVLEDSQLIVDTCADLVEKSELTLEDLVLKPDYLRGTLQDLTRELEYLSPSQIDGLFTANELGSAVQNYRKQIFYINSALEKNAEHSHYSKLKFLLTHFQKKLVSKLRKQDMLKQQRILNGGDPNDVDKAIFYYREHLAFLWEYMYKGLYAYQEISEDEYISKTIKKFLDVLTRLRSQTLDQLVSEPYSLSREIDLLNRICQGENIRKKVEKKRGDSRAIDMELDEYRYALLELWIGLKVQLKNVHLFATKGNSKKNPFGLKPLKPPQFAQPSAEYEERNKTGLSDISRVSAENSQGMTAETLRKLIKMEVENLDPSMPIDTQRGKQLVKNCIDLFNGERLSSANSDSFNSFLDKASALGKRQLAVLDTMNPANQEEFADFYKNMLGLMQKNLEKLIDKQKGINESVDKIESQGTVPSEATLPSFCDSSQKSTPLFSGYSDTLSYRSGSPEKSLSSYRATPFACDTLNELVKSFLEKLLTMEEEEILPGLYSLCEDILNKFLNDLTNLQYDKDFTPEEFKSMKQGLQTIANHLTKLGESIGTASAPTSEQIRQLLAPLQALGEAAAKFSEDPTQQELNENIQKLVEALTQERTNIPRLVDEALKQIESGDDLMGILGPLFQAITDFAGRQIRKVRDHPSTSKPAAAKMSKAARHMDQLNDKYQDLSDISATKNNIETHFSKPLKGITDELSRLAGYLEKKGVDAHNPTEAVRKLVELQGVLEDLGSEEEEEDFSSIESVLDKSFYMDKDLRDFFNGAFDKMIKSLNPLQAIDPRAQELIQECNDLKDLVKTLPDELGAFIGPAKKLKALAQAVRDLKAKHGKDTSNDEKLLSMIDIFGEKVEAMASGIGERIRQFMRKLDNIPEPELPQALSDIRSDLLIQANKDMNQLHSSNPTLVNLPSYSIPPPVAEPELLPELTNTIAASQTLLKDYTQAQLQQKLNPADNRDVSELKNFIVKLSKLKEDEEEGEEDFEDLNTYVGLLLKQFKDTEAQKPFASPEELHSLNEIQNQLKKELDQLSESIDQGKDETQYKVSMLETLADRYDYLAQLRERNGKSGKAFRDKAEKFREAARQLLANDSKLNEEEFIVKDLPFNYQPLVKLLQFSTKIQDALRKERREKGDEDFSAINKSIAMYRGLSANIKTGIEKGNIGNPLNKPYKYYIKLLGKILYDAQRIEIQLDSLNVKEFDLAIMTTTRLIERLNGVEEPLAINCPETLDELLTVIERIYNEYTSLKILNPQRTDLDKNVSVIENYMQRLIAAKARMSSGSSEEYVKDYRTICVPDLLCELSSVKNEREKLSLANQSLDSKLETLNDYQGPKPPKMSTETSYLEMVLGYITAIKLYQEIRREKTAQGLDTYDIHSAVARTRKQLISLRKKFHFSMRQARGSEESFMAKHIVSNLQVLIKEKKRLREQTRDLEAYLAEFKPLVEGDHQSFRRSISTQSHSQPTASETNA